MKSFLTVKFKARAADMEITEETVTLHTPADLFEFVSPGGDCEKIPDNVDEIKVMFLPAEHPNQRNPIADRAVVLEIGIVIFTGPLSTIVQTMDTLLDKAGRGEISESFLTAIGAPYS